MADYKVIKNKNGENVVDMTDTSEFTRINIKNVFTNEPCVIYRIDDNLYVFEDGSPLRTLDKINYGISNDFPIK